MFYTNQGKKLGTLWGFPVILDRSFLLLPVLFVFFALPQGLRGLQYYGMLFVVLFTGILWHELGHAVAVRRLGMGHTTIVLGGLGGRAIYGVPARHINRRDTQRNGIIIALAGPGFGLLLALVAFILLQIPGVAALPLLAEFLGLAMIINLLLNLLNLLPIYPLDGGKVVDHGLHLKMKPLLAKTWSAKSSVIITALVALTYFGFFGGGVDLLAVGFLIYFAALNVQRFRETQDAPVY